MANKVTVSAPGKLILSGEHSVVYGYPALLTAIGRRCWVKAEQITKPEIKINDQQFGTETISLPKLKQFAHKAQKAWEEFDRTNQIARLRFIKEDALGLAKLALAEALDQVKKPTGLRVAIRSEIPIGSGMGSSAALAIALIAAILKLHTGRFDREQINRSAFEVEKKIHGRPSGGDNTIVTFGGVMKFQRGKDPEAISVNDEATGPYWIIQTGKPEESTGEMVSRVRRRKEAPATRAKIKAILQALGKVTERFIIAFQNSDKASLNQLVGENERLLEQLGVVSAATKRLIRELEKRGVVAKVCGAGGVKEKSGVVLVLPAGERKASNRLENLETLAIAINQKGVSFETA